MPDEAPADDIGALWEAAMLRGDLEAAWQQTDRIELPRRIAERRGAYTAQPEHLMWNGAAFDGRDVLVRCNHGLGDTLQFIRFVPRVRSRARSVTVLAQPHLVPLLALEPAFGHVQNGWTDAPPPAHDVEIEIMELAYALRVDASTLPQPPYLPAAAIRARGAALPPFAREGLRVGLLWASSEWDLTRSLPLHALAPLAALRGVHFYALQQGDRAADWESAPLPIEPLSRHTADIADLAAALLELDLVISVDSMVGHLAGALGVPVFLLLLHRADWRWMSDRNDSPWYPSMRLFRQSRPGAWHDVAERVAHAVDALTRDRTRPCRSPA